MRVFAHPDGHRIDVERTYILYIYYMTLLCLVFLSQKNSVLEQSVLQAANDYFSEMERPAIEPPHCYRCSLGQIHA